MKKRFKYKLVLLAALFLSVSVFGQSKEEVIAAFLEKIANYINWSEEKGKEDQVFTIAVAGDAYLCSVFNKAYHNRRIKEMPVEVVCLKKVGPYPNIDVLFLTTDKQKDLDLALDLMNTENFLLVTEATNFAQKGAHVNFYLTDDQTYHFEMNKSSLDSTGFEVDFFLLNFAKIVEH